MTTCHRVHKTEIGLYQMSDHHFEDCASADYGTCIQIIGSSTVFLTRSSFVRSIAQGAEESGAVYLAGNNYSLIECCHFLNCQGFNGVSIVVPIDSIHDGFHAIRIDVAFITQFQTTTTWNPGNMFADTVRIRGFNSSESTAARDACGLLSASYQSDIQCREMTFVGNNGPMVFRFRRGATTLYEKTLTKANFIRNSFSTNLIQFSDVSAASVCHTVIFISNIKTETSAVYFETTMTPIFYNSRSDSKIQHGSVDIPEIVEVESLDRLNFKIYCTIPSNQFTRISRQSRCCFPALAHTLLSGCCF